MKHFISNLKNLEEKKKILNETLKILKKWGLVVFPSDTVYGFLVDADSEEGVKKLIKFKNRPAGKPISVFVSDFSMLADYGKITASQRTILEQILPGPFTVVLESKGKVCKLLESEKGTLGFRLPAYPLIIELVSKFGRPLTATSANLSGRPPHYRIETFLKDLPESKKILIDCIVDIGKLPRNKPSTVIDLTAPTIKILRQGDIVFKDEKTYLSSSPRQTRRLGGYLLEKFLKEKEKEKKPLVFIIKGELGVGKTVLVKGMGEVLGINNIISPSFVIYYEYPIKISNLKSQISKFVHIDLYNVSEEEEFRYLKIDDLLKEGNILCIEWGEKAGELYELLKNRARVIYVKMRYKNEKEREIIVKN